MKKFILPFVCAAVLAACGGGGETKTDEKPAAEEKPAVADISTNPDYQAGLKLVAASDCTTCHKVDEKILGPAYRDVANKYENTDANVKMLAEKVIKGGKGVWGETAMLAHPAISQADAEQMVKYVLLLRK